MLEATRWNSVMVPRYPMINVWLPPVRVFCVCFVLISSLLCVVSGFLFQWHLLGKEVPAMRIKLFAEQSHEGQSDQQTCHGVFHLPCMSQLLWDVQSFTLKIGRKGGKGDFPSSWVKELLYSSTLSNPACSSSKENQLLPWQNTALASTPSSSAALCS